MACEPYALAERLYVSLLAFPGRDKVCSYGLFQWRVAIRSCPVSAASYCIFLQRCVPCLCSTDGIAVREGVQWSHTMCFAGVLQVASGGDSIVEPYFVVYFREWGSQFGTPRCLTIFEIQKKLFSPFLLVS